MGTGPRSTAVKEKTRGNVIFKTDYIVLFPSGLREIGGKALGGKARAVTGGVAMPRQIAAARSMRSIRETAFMVSLLCIANCFGFIGRQV